MTNLARSITGGIDKHLDVHVESRLWTKEEPSSASRASPPPRWPGKENCWGWLERVFSSAELVGVEGTGFYGAWA